MDADQAKTFASWIGGILTTALAVFGLRQKQVEKLDARFAAKADKDHVDREFIRVDGLLENRREAELKIFDLLGNISSAVSRIEGRLEK